MPSCLAFMLYYYWPNIIFMMNSNQKWIFKALKNLSPANIDTFAIIFLKFYIFNNFFMILSTAFFSICTSYSVYLLILIKSKTIQIAMLFNVFNFIPFSLVSLNNGHPVIALIYNENHLIMIYFLYPYIFWWKLCWIFVILMFDHSNTYYIFVGLPHIS